jgi:hypothetical protein
MLGPVTQMRDVGAQTFRDVPDRLTRLRLNLLTIQIEQYYGLREMLRVDRAARYDTGFAT